MKLEGVDHVTTWVGSGAERFVLVLDQIFPQSNVSQMVVLPKDMAARERLRKTSAGTAGDRVPGGARPRQAAAERAAGAVPGAVPRRRPRPGQGARVCRRGEGHHARQPEPARHQRQLERIGQGAAARCRPGQGAHARRVEPGDRAGRAHDQHRHHRRSVPRWRQPDRHRAAPAARRARRDHRPGATPTCPRPRPQHSAGADRAGHLRLGAGCAVARGPRLRGHGAGRHHRRPAGRDRDRAARPAVRAGAREACCRATASRWPARSRRAARARARSRPARR